MRRNLLATSAGALALLITTGAGAQQTQPTQDPSQQMTAGQAQIAEQCMADIGEFSRQAAQSGYGMVGPEEYGTPAPVGGWYGTYGPRRELNAILVTAEIFARNGREEACQMVLSELRDMHDQRIAQLEEAGIPPEQVTGWRHEQLALAQPVGEVGGTLRVDNIIGSDVRNLQDQDLGDIDDVVLDEQGQVSYVLIGRGGFLGIGRDLVPVRWQDLRAVPQIDAFVLDVPEEVFEEAPAIDRDVFADLESYGQQREQIDAYWQQHIQS